MSLTATIAPNNATNQTVSWASNDTAVATVTGSGLHAIVTGEAAGPATITVTTEDGSHTATYAVTVKELQSISVSTPPNKTTYIVGEEFDPEGLELITDFGGGDTDTVTWSPDLAESFTFNNFDPTDWNTAAAASVSLSFDVSYGGQTTRYTSFTIQIDAPPPLNVAVTGVTLDNDTSNITVGDNVSLTATITPDDATNQEVSWESSDPDVATVSGSGNTATVTGVALGTAIITVTTADGGKTATFTVTVDMAVPAAQREMVSLSGGTITGTGTAGVFISGREVTLSAFKIAKNETTYALWKEVYDWAVSEDRAAENRQYTIASEGYEGHEAVGTTPGTGTTNESLGWTAAEKASRPVTNISWRDAIVWCNAYSEMSGLTPAYYLDGTTDYSDASKVLRVSTTTSGVATDADKAVVNPAATGYRLPTEAEWEYAARGGNQSDATNWGYTYAGSGALGNVAWYTVNSYDQGTGNKDYGAHPVGMKAANLAGLKDMSGNVWELCYDWFDVSISSGTVTDPAGPSVAGTNRVMRGSSWTNPSSVSAVSFRFSASPTSLSYVTGFRLVRR